MSTKSVVPQTRVEFRSALRIHQSLTASAEKRALCWLAERAPSWVTSDQLTALGLSAQSGRRSLLCLVALQSSRLDPGGRLHCS